MVSAVGRFFRPPGSEPVAVTDAQTSRGADIDARRRRYIITMAVRTVLFLMAVFLLHGWARWVAAGASLLLPWLAVVVANGGGGRRPDPHANPTYLARPPEDFTAIGKDRTIDHED